MLVKFVSTVTPAYLRAIHSLAGASWIFGARGRHDLLEEFEEGTLREDDVGAVPV